MQPISPLAARAHATPPATGVLLVNLGTPDAPTAPAIRRYLAEFLRDTRVVDLPRPLWLTILYGFILPFRPRKLVHAYSSVWTEDGAPLLAITRRLTEALKPKLQARYGGRVQLAFAMRYGNPSIASALDAFAAAGVRRLLVLPLYPQYSASCNASSFDAVWAWMRQQRWTPEVRTIASYHDDPRYIAALADSVRAHWDREGRGEHLLMSFHGIPRRFVLEGDPYYCHCQKTGRLLADALGLKPEQYTVSFQSRLGREVWLQPYTDEVLPTLAQRGLRHVDAICPGFSADCLETLEEVAIRYRELFAEHGGSLRYIPALNDSAAHVDALDSLLAAALNGYAHHEPSTGPSADEERAARQERALLAHDRFYGAR